MMGTAHTVMFYVIVNKHKTCTNELLALLAKNTLYIYPYLFYLGSGSFVSTSAVTNNAVKFAPYSTVSVKVNEEIIIPSHWRPEVEVCLNEKSITDSARNMIIRSLVNLLFSKDAKPSRANCENVARRLILKNPFLKDDMGNGYVSNISIHVAIIQRLLSSGYVGTW